MEKLGKVWLVIRANIMLMNGPIQKAIEGVG